MVKLGHELHVRAGCQVCSSHGVPVVASTVIEPLPRGESGAHWGAYQQDRTLFRLHTSRLVTFLLDGEVPWLAVIRVHDGEIQRESWSEVPISALLELFCYTRGRIDLGYELPATLGGFAAV